VELVEIRRTLSLSSLIPKGANKRKWRYGTNATVLTVAVIAIVVLVNVIVQQHPYRIDVTRTKEYSLSEQTKAVLADLDKEVELTAFLVEGESQLTRDLIEEYRLASSKIKVEIIDPIKNPDKAREYGITSAGSVVFQSGAKKEIVTSSDMYDYSSASSYYDYNQTPDFIGEQAFTSAILKVTSDTVQKIYFISGHKELTLSSDLTEVRDKLQSEGYEVSDIALAIKGEVPDDASLIVLAGPTRDLTEAEVAAIGRYLRRGGRMIACIDSPISQEERLVNVAAMLEEWGVKLHEDLVIDPDRFMLPELAWVVPSLGYHAINTPLRNANLPVVLPYARSLEVLDDVSENLRITTLLTTSSSAWGETNLQEGAKVGADDNDFRGPLKLGVVVAASLEDTSAAATTGTEESGGQTSDEDAAVSAVAAEEDKTAEAGSQPLSDETRIIVIGDSSFMSNSYLGLGNLDFFLNAVNWAVGVENLVSIRPKTIDYEPLYLTSDQFRLVLYSTVIIVPALVLLTGMVVYLRRRHL